MTPLTDYQLIVWKKEGKFFGRVRELGILESAGSLPDLWDQVESKKREIIEHFKESGAEVEIPTPIHLEEKTTVQDSHRVLPRWMGFVGIFIASIIVIVSFLWSFKAIILDQVGLTSIILKRLDNLATHLDTMPSEKREQLHRSLQIIAREGRPFVQDIKPLLEELSLSECSKEKPVRQVEEKLLDGNSLKN